MQSEAIIKSEFSTAAREAEEASDELARLDTVCRLAPSSSGLALRLRAISEAAVLRVPEGSDSDAPEESAGDSGVLARVRDGVRVLVAALADPTAEDRVAAPLLRWAEIIDRAERLVRGGAPLTLARLTRLGEEIASARGSAVASPISVNAEAIDLALRDLPPRRPALERAVHVAALIEDPAVAEVGAALVLCAAGRTDRVRLLPFVSARRGGSGTWPVRALGALAASSRTKRLAVTELMDAREREEDRLDTLGRAAINARRGLAVLRESLACTMPSLSADLELSRPAAADALERLVDAGLATEITGRRRDRVYAYDAALAIAGAS